MRFAGIRQSPVQILIYLENISISMEIRLQRRKKEIELSCP